MKQFTKQPLHPTLVADKEASGRYSPRYFDVHSLAPFIVPPVYLRSISRPAVKNPPKK